MSYCHHNVVSINHHPRRFAPGTFAFHREHGWCDVIGSCGELRTIRWIIVEADAISNVSSLPVDVDPEEVIHSETIKVYVDEVDANELITVTSKNEAQKYQKDLHNELTFALGHLDF